MNDDMYGRDDEDFDDEFDGDDENDEEFIIPGADLRHAERTAKKKKGNPTIFNQLMAGRTVGKKVVLLTRFTDADVPETNSFVNILEIKGPDAAALPVQLNFGNPKIIPLGPTFNLVQAQDAVEKQQASGTLDNFNVEAAGFNTAYTPIIGVIDWGVGGVSNDSVEVDFANGTNLNLTCSFLRVRCLIDPYIELLTNTRVAGSNAVYELSAFVGPGAAKRNNAQRTIQLGNFINQAGGAFTGFSPVVPIPKFANRVWFVPGAGTAQDPVALTGWRAQIIFMSSPPTGIAPFQVNPTAGQLGPILATFTVIDGSPFQVPIPNGSMFACVRNLNAFTLSIPTLIFDLGI